MSDPATGENHNPWATEKKMRCKVWGNALFGVKMDIKIPTLADTIVSNKGRYFGAGDRTRTGTPSLAADFESATSTISSHRQVCYFIDDSLRECRCPVAVPEISRSLFAREISTAAHRSGRSSRHRRRSLRSPNSHRTAIAGGGF